jgi:hypothetical protein
VAGRPWCKKDRGPCKISGFSRGFVKFLEGLEGLGPNHNYFLKPRVPSANSLSAQGP